MQVLLVIARVTVLLFALVGAGGSVVLGFVARAAAIEGRHLIEHARELRDSRAGAPPGREGEGDGSQSAEVESTARSLERGLLAAPFLWAGGLLGLVGGGLAAAGRTGSAGVWLLVAGIGPATLQPAVLCFNFGLIAAGALSLLAWLLAVATRPRPAVA